MKSSERAYLPDNDEEFSIYSADSIATILRGMAKDRISLNASFNSGSDVLLTMVMDVDVKAGIVYLDANINDELNQRLIASGRVMFSAFFDSAKVMWVSTDISASKFEGYKAFAIKLPDRFQRIQRRNSFRVSTPILKPVLCTIPLVPTGQLVLPVFDICIEGLGVILPMEIETPMHKQDKFSDCAISYVDFDVQVSLLVMSMWEVTLKNGSKARRAGLEFIDIDRKTETIIQRFVHQMERQRIALAAGGAP